MEDEPLKECENEYREFWQDFDSYRPIYSRLFDISNYIYVLLRDKKNGRYTKTFIKLLETEENYILLEIAKQKGLLNFSEN